MLGARLGIQLSCCHTLLQATVPPARALSGFCLCQRHQSAPNPPHDHCLRATSVPLLPMFAPMLLPEAVRMPSAALACWLPLRSQTVLGFYSSRGSHSTAACGPGARAPGMLVALHAFSLIHTRWAVIVIGTVTQDIRFHQVGENAS